MHRAIYVEVYDDFRLNATIGQERQRVGVIGSGMCIALHTDVVLPDLLPASTSAQRQRWLPGMVTGEFRGRSR